MSNEITPAVTETETRTSETESDRSVDERAAKTEAAAQEIVDGAIGLGRLWARHGLTMGKLALEASATSLATTAKMLTGLADALAPAPDADGRQG